MASQWKLEIGIGIMSCDDWPLNVHLGRVYIQTIHLVLKRGLLFPICEDRATNNPIKIVIISISTNNIRFLLVLLVLPHHRKAAG